MRSTLLAAGTAVIAGGFGLPATASADLALPSTPTLPPLGGVIGTGAQCDPGLVAVQLGTTTVCVLPSGTPAVPQATSCGPDLIAVEVAGQGIVCVAADPTTIEILPAPADGTAQCRDGLVPVQIAGGSVGCLLATVAGDAGANGTDGTNGTAGSSGAAGANGAAGGSATTTTTTTSATPTTTGGGSAASSSARAHVLKPTLSLRRTLRGATRGTVRSSTQRVVVTTLGKRHGRTVRYTIQLRLKRTGKAGAARPYSGRLRIVPKTTGALRIRITSRGAGQIRTATFKRTIARR